MLHVFKVLIVRSGFHIVSHPMSLQPVGEGMLEDPHLIPGSAELGHYLKSKPLSGDNAATAAL